MKILQEHKQNWSILKQNVYFIKVHLYIAAYILVESPEVTCNYIKTPSECEAAARQLGLPDTSVTDDGQNGFGQDPPYCYFESGSLKFNYGGTNTGLCGSNNDKCICITGNTGLFRKVQTIKRASVIVI